jgi:phage gpG-like protein
MKAPTHPYGKFLNQMRKTMPLLANDAAILAIQHFEANFDLQGYRHGNRFTAWKAVQLVQPGRSILKGKGTLLGSFENRSHGFTARVVNTAKYAALHHNGGSIAITPKSRKFFWAMYFKHGKKGAAATYYKNLAMTKKTHIAIPARPFMLTSQSLVKAIATQFQSRLNKIHKHV